MYSATAERGNRRGDKLGEKEAMETSVEIQGQAQIEAVYMEMHELGTTCQ